MSLQEQLIFDEVLIEAEDHHRAAQDELRSDVQRWFDQLSPRQKDALGGWMDSTMQYDTCVALHAAAGDWRRCRLLELERFNDGGRQ
jgi:hypothetical protein